MNEQSCLCLQYKDVMKIFIKLAVEDNWGSNRHRRKGIQTNCCRQRVGLSLRVYVIVSC